MHSIVIPTQSPTTIACHSAVKLGDKLSQEEMETLIKEWLSRRYPATCPHAARSATA